MNIERLVNKLKEVNIITSRGQLNKQSQHILQQFPELYREVVEHTKFLGEDVVMRARLYAIRENIQTIPTCKTCGNPTTFNYAKGKFNKYCPNGNRQSCALKDPIIKNKQKQTMVDRYGVENVGFSKEIQQKRINTLQDRYGVSVPILNTDIKQKIQDTLLDRYQVSNISNIPGVTRKRTNTNMLRYGAPTYAQSLVNPSSMSLLSDREWLQDQLKDFTLSEIALSLEVSVFLVRKHVYMLDLQQLVNQSQGSSEQRELARFFDDHQVDVIINDRQIIYPRELDFYLPQHNLAIEFDGIYFHSELSNKNKRYHISKTLACNNKNIQLIHIWSTEWHDRKHIVLSRLKHAVGKGDTIHARKCKIIQLSSEHERQFFDDNHIQGYTPSNHCYALDYNGVIVAAMSFIKPRMSSKYEWELVRCCNILDHSVVGGASKLFQYFIQTHTPNSIVSYGDVRWSNGRLYQQLGFNYSHTSSPNYYYFKRNGDTNKLMARINFQKHKLSTKLTTFDPLLTEWENMVNNGYDRIWDCGNSVWNWTN